MIDWSVVTQLRDEIGEDDFAEVAEVFLEEFEEKLQEIDSMSPGEIGAACHFLKGSAAYIGMQDLKFLCDEGERYARSGQPERVDILQIKRVYELSKSAFLSGVAQKLAS